MAKDATWKKHFSRRGNITYIPSNDVAKKIALKMEHTQKGNTTCTHYKDTEDEDGLRLHTYGEATWDGEESEKLFKFFESAKGKTVKVLNYVSMAAMVGCGMDAMFWFMGQDVQLYIGVAFMSIVFISQIAKCI